MTTTTTMTKPLGAVMGEYEAEEAFEDLSQEFIKFEIESVVEQEVGERQSVASSSTVTDDTGEESGRDQFTKFQINVDGARFHVEEKRVVEYVVDDHVGVGEGRRGLKVIRNDDGSRLTAACFHQTLHLLSSVLTAVAQVRAFRGRWKVIENRLSQLPALLHEMSLLPRLSNSRVCSEVLKDLVDTLEGAGSLAVQCTELSYGGKLLTQSNLDTLCGRLNFHIHDCQVMLTGDVMQENPMAICRASPDSVRETTQWTVQGMLAHLQIGSTGDGTERVLDVMVRLMAEDDKNVVAIAGQGAVGTLVRLLDAAQMGIRERAAAAVSLLALNESCEPTVVAEGGVAPLVRLLECGTPRAQERAAAALQGLTSAPDEISAHGGVVHLIEVCRSGTPAAQAAAAGALRNLAAVKTLRRRLAEEGAIPVAVTLVNSGTAVAQEHAAGVLENLAAGDGDDNIRWRVAEEGGVPSLIRYLDGSTQASTQVTALGALRYLAACRDNVELLRSAGFLPRLTKYLRTGPVAVQVVAANAVCHVACAGPEARGALGEAGVVGALVELLEAKSPTLQEYAAQALALLFLAEENQKLFLAEDWGVEGLVQQLDARFQKVDKQFPVAALQALSTNAKCRKQMIMSGACFHLHQLADADVPGARKLLTKLEGGKIKSIISKTLMINSFTN